VSYIVICMGTPAGDLGQHESAAAGDIEPVAENSSVPLPGSDRMTSRNLAGAKGTRRAGHAMEAIS
jgi:hypothetical protein